MGLVKDTADFYENKHVNSDLISINFTQYTDEEVYEALYKANMKLINKHMEVIQEKNREICDKLYHQKNTEFRGFRQT